MARAAGQSASTDQFALRLPFAMVIALAPQKDRQKARKAT
jgi:hypothetical protein